MKTNGYHNHKLEENARLRKGTRKGRNRKPALRILSATLSLSMLLSGCGPLSLTPLTAIPGGVEQLESALQNSAEDGGDSDAAKRTDPVITGFADLTDDIREQTVPLGTAIEDLTLPDTLEAYIVEKDAENGGGGGKTAGGF